MTAMRSPRGGMYYEDFEVGSSTSTPLRRTVTQMDNMLFSNMTLNPQPLHIDREFCEKETEWGQPLMNSLFTLGLMVGIQVNDMTVGTTIANLGMTEVKFPHPLFEGDTIHCTTRGARQARIEVARRRRHRRPAHPRLQPGRQAGRRVPAPGLHADAAEVMRSCVHSCSSRPTASRSSPRAWRVRRRRADPRPRGFGRGRPQGRRARDRARLSSSSTRRGRSAPQLCRARQRARHRPDRCGSRCRRCRAGPTRSCCPRREGGAAVIHLDAKLTAREAIARTARRRDQDHRARDRDRRRRCSSAAPIAAQARASIGITWGAGGLVGRARRGDQPRRATAASPRPIGWRATCRWRRPPPRACRRSTRSMSDFRNMDGLARRKRWRRAATASPPRWRSIRRRSRSSTRCSRPRRRRSPRRRPIVAAFAADPAAGVVGIGGVMYDRPHLTRAQRLLARVERTLKKMRGGLAKCEPSTSCGVRPANTQ